jgi:hypothetical protein
MDVLKVIHQDCVTLSPVHCLPGLLLESTPVETGHFRIEGSHVHPSLLHRRAVFSNLTGDFFPGWQCSCGAGEWLYQRTDETKSGETHPTGTELAPLLMRECFAFEVGQRLA